MWQQGLMQMIGDSIQNNKNITSTVLTNQQNRKQFKRDRAVAFDREDSALQRRVADARAAGVHPLFALGANVQSSPVFGTANEAPRFQGDLGGAMAKMMPDKLGTETHRAALQESAARTKLMNAQADDIVARSIGASVGARAMQNANSQQDVLKVIPSEQTSAKRLDKSTAKGIHPAHRTYQLTKGGLLIDLPYSEEGPSEALENVPFYLWPVVIQHNRSKYGDDWGGRFIREFMYGKDPVWTPMSKKRDPFGKDRKFGRTGFGNN